MYGSRHWNTAIPSQSISWGEYIIWLKQISSKNLDAKGWLILIPKGGDYILGTIQMGLLDQMSKGNRSLFLATCHIGSYNHGEERPNLSSNFHIHFSNCKIKVTHQSTQHTSKNYIYVEVYLRETFFNDWGATVAQQ
jgi:hypothetical protein